jgi:hypothetical protein
MEAAILKKKNSEPFVHSKTETAIVLRKWRLLKRHGK